MMVALTAAILGLLAIVASTAQAQTTRSRSARRSTRVTARRATTCGSSGTMILDGRSAYQPLTKLNPVNDQWYTYVGHHAGEAVNSLTGEMEHNGTSIVRVTNPRRPRLVAHIPPTDPPGGENQRQAQMVRICNGEELPNGDPDKVYMLRVQRQRLA